LVWFDSEIRGTSEEPLNQGTLGSALDMTTIVGTPGVTGDDATLGHPLWRSNASGDAFRNNLALGSNALASVGDDVSFAAVIKPGTRGALGRHEFFNTGDIGDGTGTSYTFQHDVLFDTPGASWQWQWGASRRTPLISTVQVLYLVVGYLPNVQTTMETLCSRRPLVGGTWDEGTDIGSNDGRLAQKMQMFNHLNICNSQVAHVMFWNTGNGGGLVDRDAIHQYFVDRYGL